MTVNEIDEFVFEPDLDYINALVRHSRFQKNGSTKASEFSVNEKKLRQAELKMSAREIINNTKLAFKN